MIESIGIDIIKNERIEKSINEKFINMILHPNEIKQYNTKVGKKKIEFVCGRFCAKESIIKCFNNSDDVYMNEIEIVNNSFGKPIVKYNNYKIMISISHENDYTIAEAILIK